MTKAKFPNVLVCVLLVISVHVTLRGLFILQLLFICRIHVPRESSFYSEIIKYTGLQQLRLPENTSIQYDIKTAIAVTGNALLLTVGNAITQTRREITGGAGLITARRRPDVIYAGRQLPGVVENGLLHIVNLKIELDHES